MAKAEILDGVLLATTVITTILIDAVSLNAVIRLVLLKKNR